MEVLSRHQFLIDWCRMLRGTLQAKVATVLCMNIKEMKVID